MVKSMAMAVYTAVRRKEKATDRYTPVSSNTALYEERVASTGSRPTFMASTDSLELNERASSWNMGRSAASANSDKARTMKNDPTQWPRRKEDRATIYPFP